MQSLLFSTSRALRVGSFAALLGAAMAQGATLGTTTVALDSGTVGTLVGAGIMPGAVAPGTLTGLTAAFPIISVDTTGTMISHSGGLSFSNSTTTVDIENFVINLGTDKLTGDVYTGTTLAASGVTFFDIGAGNALTLDASLASAVNGAFGTALAAGTPIGTASVSLVSATPEPSSLVLLGIGGVIGWLVLRRRTKFTV